MLMTRLVVCCCIWVFECLADAQTNIIYFLVGPLFPRLRESYVLPLSKPEDIAHARDLVLWTPVVTNGSNRVEWNHPVVVA